jgi:methyl-accepting chemotaxis protein
MTIQKKLLVSPIILLALFIIMGLLSRFEAKRSEVATLLIQEATYMQMMLRGINEVIITEAMADSVELAHKGLDGFDGMHQWVLTQSASDEIMTALEEDVSPRWEKLKADISPFLDTNIDTEDSELMVRYGSIIADADSLIEDVQALAQKAREEAETATTASRAVNNVVMVLILAGISLLFFRLYRSVMSPIREMTSVSAGFEQGDLSKRMDEARKDEFGVLASHFNQAAESLNGIAGSIGRSTNAVASSATELEATADSLHKWTGDQTTQTMQSATAMSEMSQTILDVAKNAAEAAEASRNAAEMASGGRDIVSETVQRMRDIADSVKEASATITRLGESSVNIGTIVNVINEIADQTNLLALNAAIEAARAGEQGRGFAVVADEVRKLAERTGGATKEIVDMISEIQADTEKSIASMESGTARVEEGVRLVEKASGALDTIVEVSTKGSSMVNSIAVASEEQSAAVEEISQGIENISSITQSSEKSAGEVRSAAEALSKLSAELSRMASWFKTG